MTDSMSRRTFWDPFTLSFSESQLEKRYEMHLTRSLFVSVDQAFANISIVFASTLALILVIRGYPHLSPLSLLNTLQGICAALILRYCPDWYLKNRTILILLQRCCRIGISAYGLSLIDPNATQHNSVFRAVVFCVGFTMYPFGLPLIFKVRFDYFDADRDLDCSCTSCIICLQWRWSFSASSHGFVQPMLNKTKMSCC